jgi:ferric-dicitrate binding protein FerR (iron transport regulator)
VNPRHAASVLGGIISVLASVVGGCNKSNVPDNGKPTNLTPGIVVQLRHGSRLRVIQTSSSHAIVVQLQGMCRFRIDPPRPSSSDSQYLIVQTRGASIETAYAEFQVLARSDTTEVSVSYIPSLSERRSDVTVTSRTALAQPIHLQDGMALRLP